MAGAVQKHAELAGGIRRFFPVRQIMQPNQRGAREGAQELRGHIGRELHKACVAHREAQRDRRIQVCIAASASNRDEDASHHGQRPARGNDYPSAVLRFRAFQHHSGDDSIAEQHQYHRA